MQVTMDGTSAVIVAPDTGKQYHLDAEQVAQFNQQYGVALEQSTHEYLTGQRIDEQIASLQNDFTEQKESLIDQAKQISEVTAIAAEIEAAEESRKIELQAYAVDNELTEISDNAVQTFNVTIDDMVAASRTANMMQQYRGAIIESTAFATQATQTTQQFFDQATMVADLYSDNLNIEWASHNLTVQAGFWDLASEHSMQTRDRRLVER